MMVQHYNIMVLYGERIQCEHTKRSDIQYVIRSSNGPKLIGLVRRCITLYIEKQHNKGAGYFTIE